MTDTQFTMDRFLILEERVGALEESRYEQRTQMTELAYEMGAKHKLQQCIALMRSKGYWAAKDALEAM